jgi:hypothetical protein
MRALRRGLLTWALLCTGPVIWAGCAEHQWPGPNHHLNVQALARIDHVVFVELPPVDDYPGLAGDMTVALSQAIQARRLFGLDVVGRDDPRCRELSLTGQSAFTVSQLSKMRKVFRCDAVLLGQIRNFRTHPRTQTGLILRLLDLRRGTLIWAVDDVWDTSDKAVEERIRRFSQARVRQGGQGPMEWEFALISPKAFEKFVAYEVASSLPDRTPPGGDEDTRGMTLEKYRNIRHRYEKALSLLGNQRQ